MSLLVQTHSAKSVSSHARDSRPKPDGASVAPVSYVPNPLFLRADAGRAIESLRPEDREAEPTPSLPEGETRGEDRRLGVPLDAPLLSRDEERYLFLRMNLLKCRAAELQSRIASGRASRSLRERVEALIAEAAEVRNRIAVANLRLVVSIARTFASRAHPLDELFSECQCSLLRAVELYDVDQGYRFSTYATHAVRHALGRCLERRARQAQRMPAAEPAVLAAIEDDRPATGHAAAQSIRQQRLRALVERYLSVLPERERQIVSARFGLDGAGDERTFREVGRMFRMSKERARVLTNRALLRIQGEANVRDEEALDAA